MVQQLPALIYPDSDGQPMADNTKQFRWIVVIKENLELLFAANPDVFVAGDLLSVDRKLLRSLWVRANCVAFVTNSRRVNKS